MASHPLEPPKELIDDFLTSTGRMPELQRHVESGILLPITTDDYRKQLYLKPAEMQKFQKNIDEIVTVYIEIHKHCRDFKDNMFPATVGLAAELCNYSRHAEVYYGTISSTLDKLANDDPSPSEAEKYKRIIDAIVAREATAMNKMHETASKVVSDLKQFKEHSERDKQSLDIVLEGGQEYITRRKKEIDDLQDAIDFHQKALKANGDSKWTLIPLIGWVPVAYLSTVEGIRAGRQAFKTSRVDYTTKVNLAPSMIFQSALVKCDLDIIIRLIPRAIEVIEGMKGRFQAVCKNLQDVKGNVEHPDGGFRLNDVNNVKAKWKELASHADQYRLIAWISPVDPQEFIETLEREPQ